MTTKAKISQHKKNDPSVSVLVFLLFFFLFILFVVWVLTAAKAEINFPIATTSNDNNLYSINYLYCTNISPHIDWQQRGAVLNAKLSTLSAASLVQQSLCRQTQRQRQADRQHLFLVPVQECHRMISKKTNNGKKVKHRNSRNNC